jgi:hypothetical protein
VAGIPDQNPQQFMTDSPWPGEDLIAVLQQDIGYLPLWWLLVTSMQILGIKGG